MIFKTGTNSQLFSKKNRLVILEDRFQNAAVVLEAFALAFITVLLCDRLRLHPGRPTLPLFESYLILAVTQAAALLCLAASGRMRARWTAIEKTSAYDETTGAMNRISFEKMLEEELRRAGRYHYPLTLCYLDLDNFRSFNESFGKAKSDELLKAFAQFIMGNIRFADCFARYDSDEFAILLPHTDVVNAEKFLSRILAQVQERLDCSFSAGVTAYQGGETASPFFMRASTALHQAKKEGKKRIRHLMDDGRTVISF